MSKIDKATSGESKRTLTDSELDAIHGGIQDSETVGLADSENPGVIYGFNPQPDPPGAPRVLGR